MIRIGQVSCVVSGKLLRKLAVQSKVVYFLIIGPVWIVNLQCLKEPEGIDTAALYEKRPKLTVWLGERTDAFTNRY